MPDSAETPTQRIFISYRRDDTQHMAGRISDRLDTRFGQSAVFMDVDSIEPGADFTRAIDEAVGACQVLIALIGQKWSTASDEAGNRRLSDPDDFVALEIGSALRRDVRVIPVLIDGATMPKSSELPSTLTNLTRRNAVRVDHESFSTDIGKLLGALDHLLAGVEQPKPGSTSSIPGSESPDPPEDRHAVTAPDLHEGTTWSGWLVHRYGKMSLGELHLAATALSWHTVPMPGMMGTAYTNNYPDFEIPYAAIEAVEFKGALQLSVRCRDGTTYNLEVAPLGEAGAFRMPNSPKRKRAREDFARALKVRVPNA